MSTPSSAEAPKGAVVLCRDLRSRCSCEVHTPPTPEGQPKTRRPKLTPEERAQNKKDSMQRWYERTKEERREAKMLWARQHYAENREVILARLRESRRRKKEEKKAAEEAKTEGLGAPHHARQKAAEEAAPSVTQAAPAGLE